MADPTSSWADRGAGQERRDRADRGKPARASVSGGERASEGVRPLGLPGHPMERWVPISALRRPASPRQGRVTVVDTPTRRPRDDFVEQEGWPAADPPRC